MEALNQRPDVINFIKTVAQEQGIKNPTITHAQTNEKGEGYLGQIFIVTILDATTDRKLDVVIKASFANEKLREFIPVKECFENEIHFYTKIYPFFKKIEQECGVVENTQFIPKYYKVLAENDREFICLENLKESGFDVFPKTDVLDHEHVSLIFETYGRFHAYSFALRDQKPEEYSAITSEVSNMFKLFLDNPNDQYKEHVKGFGKMARQYLIPGEDDSLIEKFEKYKDYGIVNFFVDCVTQISDYPAFLHGDCWSNNMMFKYEKSGNTKKLIDMRLLDLQLIRIGSPVQDLSYCLYSGGSKVVFDNLYQYLEIYHKSFSSFLKELGSDPEKLFPFHVLKEEWKKYAKWGMIMGFAIWRAKATNKEDVIDYTDLIDKDKMKAMSGSVRLNEELLSSRVREILYHMAEIDAL